MTKYFVDQAGRYLGGFEGAGALETLPPGAREVEGPPEHGADVHDGTAWVADQAVRRDYRFAEINAARDAAIATGKVVWDNKNWHLDKEFQGHLTSFIGAFQAGLLPENATVAIRTADNTVEQLNLTQLKQLAGVVLARVQQIWAESWAAKDALQ